VCANGGGGSSQQQDYAQASKHISLIAKNFYVVKILITHTHKMPERAFCGSSRLEIFFFFLTITFFTKGVAV
jgi:hypothetical protein